MDPYLILDIAVVVGFFILVIGVGIGMSRDEKETSEDYFLAGRGLSWWLIGFSLIAANISSEQFIGMSGQAAMHVGLAIASYEWMAAVTLVVVAFFFLPKFLRAGIYTIPEFLEYRFTRGARSLMSALMVLICVLVSFTAVVYSGALTAEVLFADAPIFGFEITLTRACWIIGALSAVYVVAGGLKACAWADLIQGASLILGGAIVTYLAFQALGDASPESIGLAADQAAAGPVERFAELNRDKLHMALPANDLILPWTALMLGLWIPNFYYWGLNQYITQRTLGAQSVAAGQRGVVFAAALKLIIPFIIVIPGIIAFNLFSGDMRDRAVPENQPVVDRFNEVRTNPASANVAFAFNANFADLHREIAAQMLAFNREVAGIDAPRPDADTDLAAQNDAVLKRIAEFNRDPANDRKIAVQSTLIGYKHDAAFPLLMKKLVFNHPGIRGFVVAALYGAVISSLAAVLNAASTLFTMDLYRQYLNTRASQSNLVATGRICVLLFTIIGCSLAPQLNNPEFKGIFTYIQEFQGFFSPGVLAVFLFGLFVHRAPRICGLLGLLITPPVYAFLKWGLPQFGFEDIAFLNRMAITFGVDLVVLTAATLIAPLSQPVTLPEQTRIAVDTSPGAKFWGAIVVLLTLTLYWFFW
jgi:SSS family solute:Na+ symporter